RRRLGRLVMLRFSDEDRARVAAAIAGAEAATAAEIICVVMRATGAYWATPALWAIFAAIAVAWPLVWLTEFSASVILLALTASFILFTLLLAFPLRRRAAMTPRWIRRMQARLAARAHFSAQGLHRTEGRTGVLIFVAAAEQYAEILADDAIAAKVDDETWRETIAALLDALAKDRASDGLVMAVERCGAILASIAPPSADNRNELPDKVIVI
ncbi:MAG: hypothetical protein ABWZ80_11585, partial [Beijerinckiaceae bacterium]